MANVTVIPATRNLHTGIRNDAVAKRKTAGYARVSTDSEEQLTSYEAQVDYYTNYIKSRPEWEFVNVYTEIKLAYLIQRERAEYWGNRRNKGIWRYWIASDAFFFLWVL